MSTRKAYDIAAIVGSYTDREGKQKNRYKNVGVVLEKDDGGRFLLLDRDFNPAGVPFDPARAGDNRILLSLFEPRQDNAAPGAAPSASAPAPHDDIPF